ncbi:MFS transporter [Aerococcus urinae]|uniref:MFS transporter n=1 Tax=Aerococcus TaxID=1375 RepID=UPI000DCB4523|nr:MULTISPECIES: MFS transporter [Aerococcus]MCY3034550.1 MFS transporter [Aerococcus mictus]MCY3063504.1 MFS transporter [Aerococcus mictus]MDK7195222.1 MFS transporter [Aerococcus urinae]MDK7716378.1 MFS transporter [Aerococcus urinae]MDK7919447.1 MFS transporter [Aerococcus urinae]
MTKNSQYKRFLQIFALGMVFGTMFNLPYIKYVFYDAIIEAMNVNNSQLGLLVTIYSIASIFALIPSGWLADRYSAKPLMVWSAIIQGILTLWFAFNMQNYIVASIVWAAAGVTGASILWTANLKAVRLSAPPEEQGTAYGFWEAMCGLSAMLCNFLALGVFSRGEDPVAGLKMAIISMAVTNIIGAFAVQFLYDESSQEAIYSAPKEKVTFKQILQLFKKPGLYLASVIIFCTYGIFANQSFLTPYTTNVLGAAVTFAGGLAIMRSYGLKLIGGPLGGVISDKIGSASKLQIIAYIGVFACLVGILLSPAGSSATVTIVTVLMLVLATFCFMARGSMWATVDEAGLPIELSGSAISIISLIGFSGADVILPPLMGSWVDNYGDQGYTYILYFLGFLCVVGIVASLCMLKLKSSNTNEKE